MKDDMLSDGSCSGDDVDYFSTVPALAEYSEDEPMSSVQAERRRRKRRRRRRKKRKRKRRKKKKRSTSKTIYTNSRSTAPGGPILMINHQYHQYH